MAIYVTKCYKIPAGLYVMGGSESVSNEGTTQGDQITMSIYAIGILPLLSLIISYDNNFVLKHIAYADDLTGLGYIDGL